MTGQKETVTDKITLNPVLKAILFQAAAVAAGFAFAYSGRQTSFSPLGVAAVSASDGKYKISVCVGSALGYVMFCDSLNALRYIAAILCAFVMSKLLQSFDFGSSPVVLGAIGGFCVLATGAAMVFTGSFSSGQLLFAFTEGLCSFCAGFIMTVVFSLFRRRKTVKSLSLREYVSFSFFTAIVLWSLYGFSFPSFSPVVLIAFYLVLSLTELFSGLGSVVLGCVYCVVFSALSEGVTIPLSLALGSVAVTVAFFMSTDSRFRAVYLLVACALAYLLGLPKENSFIFEAVTAAVLFSLTPKKYIRSVTDYLSGAYEPMFANEIKNGLSARLHMASSAVDEISAAVRTVCSGLDRQLPSARNEVFSRVTGTLCSGCANYRYCWQEDREKTVAVFDALFMRLKNNEHLDVQNMPIEAKNRCIKAFQLSQAFNGSFGDYSVESVCQRQKNEMRLSVAEQFCSVGDIIDDVALSLEESCVIDTSLSEKVRAACFSAGINPARVICKYNENGRLEMEIECEQIPAKLLCNDLKEKLEKLCLRKLEQPVIISGEAGDYITVCEKHNFLVEVGTSQITCNGEKLCGDSVEHFYDGRGKFDVVLADGMGTGARAALDSAMARGLTGKLLKKGISPDGTVRLVNSALMVKSPEESMSSLDIMQVDMFSGKTEFFKAGAASSFVKHKGRIQEIRKPALPLGILHNVELASMKGSVSCGDIAVMMSDGVADCGEKVIREIIRKNASAPSEKLAEILTGTAAKSVGNRHDDLTAVVCKFR
ncbi:MAG: SpoIIE family protein phosphatase [Clostridia bacterium]|nr:SpoIIE family protein phosphatase [Clostridia bacterium]